MNQKFLWSDIGMHNVCMGAVITVFLVAGIAFSALPVQNGLVMHLDANSIAGLTNGQIVTLWQDTSGSGNDATIGTGVVNNPTYVTNALNGLPVVRFGANNCYFTFPEIANIRTVFWVLKEDASATYNRFLLGHSTAYDFHRGGFNFWDGYWSSANIRSGTTRLNGSVINGTSTVVPQAYSIVSLITTGNVKANQLTRDRTNTAASWNGDIAEVIVYNRALTDAEEKSVGVYLAQKYGISTTYQPSQAVLLYEGPNYSAWLDGQVVELRTVSGGVLTRWPIGTTVTQTDYNQPLVPVSSLPSVQYTATTENGTPVVTWDWMLSDGAIAEQIETIKFYPQYFEQRVRVCWRDRKPIYWRVNYGGRLAGGCYDLEGLWQAKSPGSSSWLPAPVPGIYTDIGTTTYQRTITAPSSPQNLTLVMGGVDDEDVTTFDSSEIGRTPLNYNTQSWAKIRRYLINASLLSPGNHMLTVAAPNSGGMGGLWRGPCVIGPDSILQQTVSADGWTRATAVGNKLFDWCPNSSSNYEQPLTGRFTVSLTSQDRTAQSATSRYVPENITTGGRFQIPPFVVAIDGLYGFWGIGTLDLPRAEDGLRIEWRDGTLTCPFLLKTGDPCEQGMWTDCPRLGIFVGNSKEGILNAYLAAIPPCPNQNRPDWWSGPEYCTWGDQVYYDALYGGGQSAALTDARVRSWRNQINNLGLTFKQITLDAGWWQLSVDIPKEIHNSGQYVVLWTQPHWAPTTGHSASWGVKDAAGQAILDRGNYILDFTQLAVQQHTTSEFGSYFTRWPQGYEADGIKLDFAYVSTPLWDVMYDESWGAGEQYRARMLQFIYQIVKSKKSDGLLTGACSNPLFGEVQGLCRLNEEWTGDPETYRRRAAAVLGTGEWVMSDDWNAYEHYLPKMLVERPVWGCMTLQSVNYRGDTSNNPVPLTNAWAKRIKAVTYLESLVPVQNGQYVSYDANGYISRNNAAGAIVAAARPLNGHTSPTQVLITAAKGCLLVATIADGNIDVPTKIKPYKIYAINHDGTKQEVPWAQKPSAITLAVGDSAGTTWYYQVITCDFNNDGIVNFDDLAILASEWLVSSPTMLSDITADGRIDFADYAILTCQMGKS
jgi:hypothetical protein